MTEELTEFALKKLLRSGVEVILNSRVIGATENSGNLKDRETYLVMPSQPSLPSLILIILFLVQT